jgi:hypothetical protein
LEQQEALRYLRGWLQHHPKYGMLVPHDVVDRLNHAEVRLLNCCLGTASILDELNCKSLICIWFLVAPISMVKHWVAYLVFYYGDGN